MKISGPLSGIIFLMAARFAVAQVPSSALRQLNDSLVVKQNESSARAAAFRAGNPVLPEITADGTRILLVDVDKFGLPVYRITMNAGAAKTTGADQLQTPSVSGLNIRGKDMLIGVWDGGTVKNHIELGQRLVSIEGDQYSDHATHVTGTLIAEGINPLARGMAPGAKATTHFYGNDFPVMSALAAPGQQSLLISNHSYGTGTGFIRNGNAWTWSGNPAISGDEDYRFGLYSTRAVDLDRLTWLAPYYSIFWATGNDRSDIGDGSRPADCNAGTGYDCIIPDAVAKNIFTIGAVNKVPVYNSPNSVVMGNYSSWGPTDDGRIKPDIVAAGTDLFSLSANGTNTYEVMGGTSMATPNASGSLALVQQLYHDLHGGTFMKSATLKALAIHTAKEAGPFPGPDYSFGWGLLDVSSAAQLLMNENDTDKRVQELTLNNGAKIEIPVQPLAGKKLTATIAWTDPPGIAMGDLLDPTTPALVNDLDIRVVDEAGVEQKPWILDPLNPVRQAFRGDNFRDNVEKIEFNSPENRTYRIVINHKGSLKYNTQDFSLVLSYQATSSPSTWYWIGNSGSWTDGSHWSATTGGTPSGKTPANTDRVIFDENSFSVDGAVVSVNSPVIISSFLWTTTRTASVNPGNNSIEVTGQIKVHSDSELFTNGSLRLNSTSTGEAFVQLKVLNNFSIDVVGGTWDWYGNASVNSLNISAGIRIHDAAITVNQLTSTTGTRSVKLSGSSITVNQKTDILGTGLTMDGADSEIILTSGPANHVMDRVTWNGKINVRASSLLLKGTNTIGTLELDGKCELPGSNTFSLLQVHEGSELTFGPGTNQAADSIYIESSAGKPVKLASSAESFLYVQKHAKYCFDHLDISFVSGSPSQMLNAGINSTLNNAKNWQKGSCADMLYSDFTWDYACTNSLIGFRDRSSGSPDRWSWSFNRPDVVVPEYVGFGSEKQNPFFLFTEPGVYPVELVTVKLNSAIDVSKKFVTVIENPMEKNTIVSGQGVLTSTIIGERYQWLRNGEVINGAVSRSYSYNGDEAAYQVAAYNGSCNSVSGNYQLLGLDSSSTEIIVSPNPASNKISISGISSEAEVWIIDALGKNSRLELTPDHQYDVSYLPSGLYLLRIIETERTVVKKIIIAK